MTAGRTDVTRRALERTVVAAASAALGVGARAVRVRLSDDRGALAVGVDAPVSALRGDGLLTRGQAWRDEIARAVTGLTGRTVSAVTLGLTEVEPQKGGLR